ncbi:hypothetical protein JQ582_41475 [Bradyrhizobium japonicum]|nr:hypothetical protein [Bradyrhizobium japonicum]MBR0750376.1 hypothetical protein [Bradyrhizobium japonicum]
MTEGSILRLNGADAIVKTISKFGGCLDKASVNLPLMPEANSKIERLLTQRARRALRFLRDLRDWGPSLGVGLQFFDIFLRPLAANQLFLLGQNGTPSMLKARSNNMTQYTQQTLCALTEI